MIELKQSPILKRKIRQDDVADMSVPSWRFIKDLIKNGKIEDAMEFMDYEVTRNKVIHDLLVHFIQEMLHGLSDFGEEQVEKIWRKILEPLMKYVLTHEVSVELVLHLDAELQRCHYSDVHVVEEPDRYVMTCDPCGAGGRLRRERCRRPASNEYTKHVWTWPWDLGVTQKPYDWSWRRTGIPYYCAHCSIMWEILPTEIIGYPVRIHVPGETPEDPCVHLYYKKPELIPEEFYRRIGKEKKVVGR
ncbi:MAG: hypothetical protein SCH71_08045 [Desulfobulbaceae bacterium]|nr:hypothetical protein [Desulfobulbaceae bacterium]